MELIPMIAKEDIRSLGIGHRAAAIGEEERSLLRGKVERAALLGNGYKSKVRIVFETVEGPRAVETTVWSADDKGIALKSGLFIPMDALYDIEL